MQIISTIALHNYKVPVIIKKFTFCLRKSRENLINIFQDFPGLTNKIQGLSRTFPGCGNPAARPRDNEAVHALENYKLTTI